MLRPYSAALPIAYVTLRVLVVLNLAMAAAILVLLLLMPNERWIMRVFDLTPGPDTDRLIFGLRVVAVLGLASVPLNHLILKRLLAMVRSVRFGDPFIPANASRLRAIAWALLGLQLVGVVIGTIGRAISSPAHPVDFDAGFSINGWLAVLLAFILSRVFAEGALMRDDLDGMV